MKVLNRNIIYMRRLTAVLTLFCLFGLSSPFSAVAITGSEESSEEPFEIETPAPVEVDLFSPEVYSEPEGVPADPEEDGDGDEGGEISDPDDGEVERAELLDTDRDGRIDRMVLSIYDNTD
ncbi:hypothetical protein KJ766_00090, partial [Patescibacteria group bacterium]|nr:hypothetical protein [Patescibacteria group bacterium]